MENPADTTGLATLWRPLTADGEEARAQARLDATWRALQAEFGPGVLVARVESGGLDEETVADVIYSATMRILTNPDGLESYDRKIDDYSEGGRFHDRTASNDLYFTAAELRRLSPTGTSQGAWTIRPGVPIGSRYPYGC